MSNISDSVEDYIKNSECTPRESLLISSINDLLKEHLSQELIRRMFITPEYSGSVARDAGQLYSLDKSQDFFVSMNQKYIVPLKKYIYTTVFFIGLGVDDRGVSILAASTENVAKYNAKKSFIFEKTYLPIFPPAKLMKHRGVFYGAPFTVKNNSEATMSGDAAFLEEDVQMVFALSKIENDYDIMSKLKNRHSQDVFGVLLPHTNGRN